MQARPLGRKKSHREGHMDRMVLTCSVVRRRGAADRKKDLHGKSINVKACKDFICSVQLVGEEEVSKTNCDEN